MQEPKGDDIPNSMRGSDIDLDSPKKKSSNSGELEFTNQKLMEAPTAFKEREKSTSFDHSFDDIDEVAEEREFPEI